MSWHPSPSLQSVRMYAYPSYRCRATARLSVSLHSTTGNGSVSTFPQQRIHARIETLLDASFSMRSVSYHRRVCGSVRVSPSFQGNNSVKTFPRQGRIVGGVDFFAARALSKERVLLRTFCFRIRNCITVKTKLILFKKCIFKCFICNSSMILIINNSFYFRDLTFHPADH
jgi:hypothetical protein